MYNHETPQESRYFAKMDAEFSEAEFQEIADRWVEEYEVHPDDHPCPYTYGNFCEEQGVDLHDLGAELDQRFGEDY